jgi:hypothetical protein
MADIYHATRADGNWRARLKQTELEGAEALDGTQLRTKTFWILVRASATAAELLKELPLLCYG